MNALQKVAVFGLDGVPYSLLKKLFAEGIMPRLADVAGSGTFLPMRSALPAVSSVAWTSFMTATNPGSHGIFGFTDLVRDELSLHLPSFDDIRCPTLWQRISDRHSVVVNLPFTYPARPLRGVLISGFVAPVFDRSVYPDSLIPSLKARNYRIDVDCVKGRNDRAFLINDLFETLNPLEDVALHFMDTEPWELFVCVVTGTDRLYHFLFDAVLDPDHPYHRDSVEYHRRVDYFFGKFLDKLSCSTRLIILSDHGFTALKTQVYLNHILRTLGHLSFRNLNPTGPEDIDPLSRAFALDPTRIYLHTIERFRTGGLSFREAAEVRERLKYELESMNLSDVGITKDAFDTPEASLFDRVLYREEIYSGDMTPFAPDLVVVPKRGYDVKATLNVFSPTMSDIFTGMHTHDDAFLIVNDPTVAERFPAPDVSDAGRLVLETFS